MNTPEPVKPLEPKPDPQPIVEIKWGGKIFRFDSFDDARKAGFHLD